jgi:hypothetical protein
MPDCDVTEGVPILIDPTEWARLPSNRLGQRNGEFV